MLKEQKNNIWCTPTTCQAQVSHWGHSCKHSYLIDCMVALYSSLFKRQRNQSWARWSCVDAQVQDTELHRSHSKTQIHPTPLWKTFFRWFKRHLSARHCPHLLRNDSWHFPLPASIRHHQLQRESLPSPTFTLVWCHHGWEMLTSSFKKKMQQQKPSRRNNSSSLRQPLVHFNLRCPAFYL